LDLIVTDERKEGCKDLSVMWAEQVQQFLNVADARRQPVPLRVNDCGATVSEVAQLAEVAFEPPFEQSGLSNNGKLAQLTGCMHIGAPIKRLNGIAP
jgi:hypothetical protein